jgi:hypothetical protein
MKTRKTYSASFTLLLFLAVAMFYGPRHSAAVTQGAGLEGRSITGTVYFVGGRASGRSLPFRLIVNRLATPEEVKRLNVSLIEGKEDELMRTLSKMDAGRIQIGNDVGVVANAIIASQVGDRTKLTVVYERYLRFSELRYGARSQDYKFGYAELYLGPGAGEGMLIPAAKIRVKDGNTWEVEDFGTFPAKLLGLQVRGGSRSNH